ncbi:MAG: hypothetical protein ACKN9U_00845, partial [Pirellulaceae bacterium]
MLLAIAVDFAYRLPSANRWLLAMIGMDQLGWINPTSVRKHSMRGRHAGFLDLASAEFPRRIQTALRDKVLCDTALRYSRWPMWLFALCWLTLSDPQELPAQESLPVELP